MALTERDLISIINAHRDDSLGADDGDLSNERSDALDHYHGRPYGDEQEGRSQVVSKDLSEAVDWAMPAIMRVFTQSGNLGEFEPVGPDDEDAATQEGDYVNQVIMKDNDGFMILHDAIKDTLLLKNGYAKFWWDVSEKIKEEEYTGLSIDQLMQLEADYRSKDAEVEILGQDEREELVGEIPTTVYDIKVKLTFKNKKAVIQAVPCEEVRVSRRCRGTLQQSPFTEHVTRKTRSELIEMGMPKAFVNDLAAFNERDNDQEVNARDSVDDESESLGTSTSDRSMDEIEYCEAYILVDWDDDGIAELRKVVTVSDKIPPGDEWNERIECVPMVGFVAKRVPHRHVGESLDDDLADLQKIKTVLLRQLLDNVYLTNNNQWIVNKRVNLKDFLVSLPGGVKRVNDDNPVNGSVEPVMTPSVVGQILPVIDYMDNIKEARTGVNKASTGMDPDILKQSTKGAFMENLNRASQKIEMITRMIAETGVKELVLQVHGLLMRHQDKARMVKMRGKYVTVNPQEWRERTNLTVRVGLGTGSEEEKRQKLMLLVGLQKEAAEIGLVGPKQAYTMFGDIAETLGFDMPEKYVLDPDSPEFKQKMEQQKNQPNPMMQIEQMKLQAQREKMQMDSQVEQQKSQANLMQEQLRSQNDVAIEREKIAAQMELERYKAQLKADTDIAIERMRLSMQQMQPPMGMT